MINLPLDYVDRMKKLLGDEFEDFIKTYSENSYQGFRINPLKITSDDFFKKFSALFSFEIESIPWCKTGFYYPSEAILSKSPLYHAGLYYLQEPSAMSPVEFLDVRPGMKVLDLCAAPGGKSIQIAGKLNQSGLLVSNDISLKRTKAVLKNIEMSGVTNCILTNAEPAHLAERFPDFFDRILVDAPCSGEGMFRKDPDLIKSYHEVLKNICLIQSEILDKASRMLKVNGRLVYSTCTFDPKENELILSDFLKNHPNFRIVKPDSIHPEISNFGFSDGYGIESVRLLPHHLKGEGHFVGILEKIREIEKSTTAANEKDKVEKDILLSQKSSSSFARSVKKHKNIPVRDRSEQYNNAQNDYRNLFRIFEAEMMNRSLSGEITVSQDSLYKECGYQNELKGLRVIRNGLYLGDIKAQTFIPSSAFIMANKKSDFKHTISFSPDEDLLYKYLRCETLHLDYPDGMYIICMEEYPLGLVKIKNGTAKNLYNQNWRFM